MAQLISGGGFRALEELKAGGEISAYGAGVNHGGTISRYLECCDLDFFLASQIYSLLHHSTRATEHCTEESVAAGASMAELQQCVQRGVGVIAATAFNAGILVSGTANATAEAPVICNYRPATADEISRTQNIEGVCAAHGVSLPAAALQFSLAHPAVASLVTGTGSAAESAECLGWLAEAIPLELWAQLKAEGAIHADAHTPAVVQNEGGFVRNAAGGNQC